MIRLIVSARLAIAELCQQFGVRKLELFGSAARDVFEPETSDIDFVIEFLETGTGLAR